MDKRNSVEIGAYLNLAHFLRYRGFSLASEPLRPGHVLDGSLKGGLTPSEVVKTILTQLGEWEIVATRPSANTRKKEVKGEGVDVMVIFLLSAAGKFSRSSPDFSRLLNSATQKRTELGLGEVGSLEVVVLTTEEVHRKKHLQAEIQNYNSKEGGASYHMYPYHIFASVVPEVPIVPKHVIIPKPEISTFMKRYHLTPDKIQKIPAMDPPVVWIGGRPGDYVCVWRLSETASARFPNIRLVV